MKTKKAANVKYPDVKIDKSLDKLLDVPMFQEKLDKANETLRRVGLPKELKQYNDKDEVS